MVDLIQFHTTRRAAAAVQRDKAERQITLHEHSSFSCIHLLSIGLSGSHQPSYRRNRHRML